MEMTQENKNHSWAVENNQVEIMGKIASQFTFSHQVFGEGFYMVDVLVKRLQRFRGQDSGDDLRETS